MTAPIWVGLVGAFGGVLLGGGLSLWLASLQYRHQRKLAFRASQREAYLQILTWFSQVRDDLRMTSVAGQPWKGSDLNNRRENAQVDALTELYGSPMFRSATKQWATIFQQVLPAYESWVDIHNELSSDPERQFHPHWMKRLGDLNVQTKLLEGALATVQDVARREAAYNREHTLMRRLLGGSWWAESS